MNIERNDVGLGIILVALVVLAWWAPLDKAAHSAIDDGLKRSMVTFATARAINGVLSVAESVSVSGGLVVSGSATIGRLVHPINTFVEQFAELALAATVAFGVMKFALVLGGSYLMSGLLTVVVVSLWVVRISQTKPIPRFMYLVLFLTLIARFSIPVAAVGSGEIYKYAFSDTYSKSQKGLSVNLPEVPDISTVLKQPKEYFDKVKMWADNAVENAIKLIALFLLETLLIPLLLLWILIRLVRYILLAEAPRLNLSMLA